MSDKKPLRGDKLYVRDLVNYSFYPYDIQEMDYDFGQIRYQMNIHIDGENCHHILHLDADQFDDLERIMLKSDQGFVKVVQRDKHVSFVDANLRKWNRPEIPEVEKTNHEKPSWFNTLCELPTIIDRMINDVRFIASQKAYATTKLSVEYTKANTSFYRSEVRSLKQQLSDKEYIITDLENKILRQKERLAKLHNKNAKIVNSAQARIIELENHISNSEEDILRESEKIKARLALEANKDFNK